MSTVIEDSRNRNGQIDDPKSQIRDRAPSTARPEQDLEQARQEPARRRSAVGRRALELARRVRVRIFPAGTRRDRGWRRLMMGIRATGRLGIARTTGILVSSPRSLIPALRAAHADGQLLNRQYQSWIERHRLSEA